MIPFTCRIGSLENIQIMRCLLSIKTDSIALPVFFCAKKLDILYYMQYNAIKERAKGPKKMKRKGKFIMTFYFSETTDTNSFKKALQLKATNLTAAKKYGEYPNKKGDESYDKENYL